MIRLVLDLSRTLSRAIHAVPTGIDRVEMAYAEALLARVGDRLDFAAMHPLGRFGILPRKAAESFLALVAARWRHGAEGEATARAARSLYRSILLGGDLLSATRLRRDWSQAAYLLMSHHHLDRPAVINAATRRGKLALICLVHDLIPLEFKEYTRPAEPARHQQRIETVAQLAGGVVVNSHATRRSLQPWLDRAGRNVPVLVAPLGTDLPEPPTLAPPPTGDDRPYFVFLGTIEPRKNHLLALHVWRRLAAEMGPRAPRLILIGRRGWEIEQVIDLVERCDALRGLVVERGDVSDRQALDLMRGARALILPSFAEGYGLPVAEALAHGVPVLCSDLPAFREVGQDVPEYFDPMDGMALLRAVQDYTTPASPRRAAQMARLHHWRPPSWEDHITTSLAFTEEVVRTRVPCRAPRQLALDTAGAN